MASSSPSGVVKQVDTSVSMILRKVDPLTINEKAAKAIVVLRQALVDSRIYSHDYELSETREEQVDNAKHAKKYLEQARASILKASEFDVFGPVDVAHLSAQIDLVIGDLK